MLYIFGDPILQYRARDIFVATDLAFIITLIIDYRYIYIYDSDLQIISLTHYHFQSTLNFGPNFDFLYQSGRP